MTAEEYLAQHGINQASIQKFELFYTRDKIVIPVKDVNQKVLYNKYRHLDFDPSIPESRKYSFDEGAKTALFNIQALEETDYIFITEGEMDCIRLDQEGIAAITNTSGASTWKEEWSELIEQKAQKVYIILDNDKAGQEGANRILEQIPTAFNIKLPTNYKDVCDYFVDHNKDDFRKLVDSQVKENTMTYDELCSIIDKWLLIPDKNIIKILMAVTISHFFKSDPLWMFFVAPPSGSKTEIVSTIAELPFVRMLSDLTAQTFASGMNAKKDPSLLLEISNHVLVMKDFTTVLTMRREDRQVILSQLREIYDGKYSKAFGTGKVVEWEGRLTLIAGVTPIIDTHSALFQVMGERFIMYRVPQSDDKQVSKKALKNYGMEKQMRIELKTAIKKFFLSLTIPDITSIELPEDILDSLASLASFIVKARSVIIRDQSKREIEYIPTPEAPARLAKQLGVLIKALAVLDRRTVVNWEDFYLTLRVALDIIPANRMAHIQAVCCKSQMINTTEISQITDYSRGGSEMILEDLVALKILKVERVGSGSPNRWGLSESTKNYFKDILPVDDQKLYSIFPEESNYMPVIKEILSKETPVLVKEEVKEEKVEEIETLSLL